MTPTSLERPPKLDSDGEIYFLNRPFRKELWENDGGLRLFRSKDERQELLKTIPAFNVPPYQVKMKCAAHHKRFMSIDVNSLTLKSPTHSRKQTINTRQYLECATHSISMRHRLDKLNAYLA